MLFYFILLLLLSFLLQYGTRWPLKRSPTRVLDDNKTDGRKLFIYYKSSKKKKKKKKKGILIS